MAENRPVRYGIIGFGKFAEQKILPAIRRSKNSRLVALQKRSMVVARKKADQYGVPHAFDTVESLVEHPDVEAVFIASANSEHCAETLKAARSGKHVIVEKPMAMSVGEAKQMIESCAEAKVRLMVGHMVRLSPLVVRMKDLISAGRVGIVTHIHSEFIYDGRRTERGWLYDRTIAGGGPVFDIGVHCLDTMRAVLDDEVVSVRSELHPLPTMTRTESTAHISLKFSRGAIGSIYCSYEAPLRRSRLEIIGTEGILWSESFTLSEQSATLHMTLAGERNEEQKITEIIEVPDLYDEEITMFSESIRSGSEIPLSGENALENQRILDAVMMNV